MPMCCLKILIGMLLIVVALEGSRPFTIVSTSSSVTLRKLKVSFVLITSLILRID